MRQGSPPYLLFACAAALAVAMDGCSFVGESEVRVESGNQPSGYLSRPMSITASSDETVQQVAQRICDNVRRGSTANVTFVGRIPGPGPISVSDWGRYHYDCTQPAAATKAAPVAPPAPPAPPSLPVVRAAPASAAAASPAASAEAPLTDAQEQRRRECQRRLGTYQICVGSCLASSSSASGVVEAECAQRCAAQAPSGCN